MIVGKRMSFPVITIQASTPVPEALARMSKEDIHHMVVVEKNKMVGIVTRNDLLNAAPSAATSLSVWEINYLINRIKVEDVMAKEVVSITEDTPIEEAARIMVENDFSCLPIMRGKDVVGIITESDVFKLFLELFAANEKGVRLTLEIDNTPGALARILEDISGAGGNLLSLGSFAGDSISTSLIAMKVDGISQQRLIELVEPNVIKITDIRTF